MDIRQTCPTLIQLMYTIKAEEPSIPITICTNNNTFPEEHRYERIWMSELFIELRKENEDHPLFYKLVDRFVLKYPKENEDLRHSGEVSFEIFLV